MIVACDPVMCQQLQAHGFAAGDLLVLTASTSDPLGSDVVIATSVIRNKFGSRLSGVYAPLVIASLGSGTARIDIRVTALDGTAAYLAAMRADRIARQAAGAQLLRNHRVAASASARQVIVAGSADARILITLATMAALHPVRVAAFGAAPGAGPQAPLRSVEITPAAALTPAAAIAQLDALRVFALAQRHPYLPALAEVDLLSGGTPVLRIEFGAPSPLGLLGAHPTP
jgi:hypothetical protein